ncbi:MAG: hypothetical protein KIT84_21605 [Labilithrix sp.]|nr:hypothetical protein [Labilithrix sp.]MCW5813641.1 hypothetical protein [Labilithrix sp.]
MKLRTVAIALALFSCKSQGEKSAEDAAKDVQKLVEMTDKDVAEIERGLPEGAKKIVPLLEKELGKEGDPKSNLPAVRSALLKMRQQVPDLGIAKSTFFAYADDKGVAYRNDFEHDTMNGKDLVAAWPGLKPATESAAFAATNGPPPDTTPHPAGPDKDWVAAVPVKKADGSKYGLLVTGWTYRRFAYHLQVTAQREVQDQLMRNGDKGKMPVLYVCMFDKDGVYCATAPGAPKVPPVNEKTLTEAGLHAATAESPASKAIKIEERDFGWAAARTPRLGADVGVVVLRSNV